MKLWEVFKALEENPKKVFEFNDVWKTAKLSNDDGWFKLKFYGKDENLISESCGGVFNGNINSRYEWHEVKQPVPWREAFEAWLNGTPVSCVLENGKQVKYDQNTNFIHAHSLKTGTWYIED